METSLVVLLFVPILLANTLTASILRNGANPGEVACDPAANPSDCPSNRRCEDMDGDGQSTCVCDSRFYKTNAAGNCVLGLKELIYEMEKEIETLKGNVSNNANDIASNEAQISMNSANITAAGDQVNMDALDEMKDKIDALNETLSGDLDQVMMDIDEMASKQEKDMGWLNDTLHELLVLPTTPPPPEPLDTMLIVGDFYPTNFVSVDGSVNCTISTGRGLDDFSSVGFFDGTTPVTCGGDCSNTKCYNIIDGTEFAQMDKGRYAQGFVMINPSTLWITGGSCGSHNGYAHNQMPFTEFISTTPNVTGPGPDLPVNMNAQCLTKVGDKVYVIGGRKAPGDNGASYTRLDTVYIYDFSQFDTTGQPTGPETGPTLNLGRESFGCGTLENGAIIVAGGEGTVGGRTNTAEILLPGATSWITLTENLPESWRFVYPMLTMGNTAYVIGGYSSDKVQNDIIKTECDDAGNCSPWETIGYWEGGRWRHAALWIPKSVVPCTTTNN